ncbi:Ig-like domain-containing protein [Pseudomonas chlororaphis]|uniref:Biofilm associated protein A n=1 Tax=Pseudomonas chlororaphis O6 TaxID=1037915 RepID=A0AB33WVK9_9PSED|nr:Ig-like domain-containing protein [Pseudomonas chlororaphis]EIM17077.1 biofilm associated protein A [Pseudomonas chlororaphis O6]
MKDINVSVSVVDGKTITSVQELVQQSAGKPVRIKAIPGGKYLLAEGEQGFAPENITLKRVGKNLHVALEGTDPDQPELIIEDFYEYEGQLVGMAEDSTYHEYVAVDGDDDSAVAFLIDGATSAQALGAAELAGFGDGLAMLAGSVFPTAALGLGALGILGAGAAIAGGGGGSKNKPQPQIKAPVAPEIGQILDNVGDQQGAIQPGQSTDDNTPTITGTGEPGSTIEIIDNGNVIGEVVVDGNGNWEFTPAPLPDGGHVITVRPEGGNESGGVEIIIDTQAPGQVSIDGVTDDFGPKTGAVAHQGQTDDNTPTLNGRAEPGSLVSIYDRGQLLGTTQADANGQWVFTPAALADGEHHFTATATDAAGNIGLPSELYAVTIKTNGPLKPEIGAITDNEGPIVGELDNPAVTTTAPRPLSGSGEPGDTVTIIDNGNVIGEVVVGGNGSWEFTPAPLEEGNHNFEVVVTDPNGNSSEPSDPWPVVIDTTAPEKPGLGGDGHGLGDILDDVGDIQGSITPGGVTDDTKPTLVGTGEPGDTVTIIDNGNVIGSVVVGENGQWTFTPAEELAEGQHDFSVIFTDPAGNSSEASDPWPVLIDTMAPEKPQIGEVIDDIGSVTGPIGSGEVTDDNKPTLSGSGEAGGTVTIIDNGQVIGETVVDENGQWTFTPEEALEDGEHKFEVVITDPAGNSSEPSDGHVVIIDTAAPNKPVIEEVIDDIGSITGPIDSGDVTDDNKPTLSGSGEPGDTVTIIDNGNAIGEVVVDEKGEWTFTPEVALEDGKHEFEVVITDPAGNSSEPSDPYVVIIDTQAPSKPTIDTVYDDQGDKQGNLIAGETTDDAKPTISGKAEAGSTVVIMDKGQEIGRAQANEAGEWTFTPSTPLGNGGHDLSVKAIDAAGNASEPSDNFGST